MEGDRGRETERERREREYLARGASEVDSAEGSHELGVIRDVTIGVDH